ncbi:MAG: hypothetical protein ABTR20_16240 [Candidatus Competibacter sp.]
MKRYYHFKAANPMLSKYVRDTFIAHKLSELSECSAPELKEEPNWLNAFILKSIVVFDIPAKNRAYLLNFLRRAEAANTAYREARTQLSLYLSTPQNVISPYFKALTQFEVCIAWCYQGYELIARASGSQLYRQGHGSRYEKLQIVYVDSKHMDFMISGDKLPSDSTSGLWIINSGLESSRGCLTFEDLHCLLCEMKDLAEKIVQNDG